MWIKNIFRGFLLAIVISLILPLSLEAADFDKLNQKLRAKYTDIEIVTVEEVYQQLQTHQDSKTVLILDARSEKEYQVSHIQGAQLTPDIKTARELLAGESKDTMIVVYCSLGYRSGDLTRKLEEEGYTNVVNMEGSLFEWVEKDLPVFQDDEQVEKVHPYNVWWGRNLRADYHSYTP